MIANAAIFLGVVTATTVAFEPHFSSAYRLQFGILIANLLPYMLYAIIPASTRATWVNLLGITLVVSHVLMLARPNWWDSIWGIDAAVYAAPIALAIALLPMAWFALKPRWATTDSD